MEMTCIISLRILEYGKNIEIDVKIKVEIEVEVEVEVDRNFDVFGSVGFGVEDCHILMCQFWYVNQICIIFQKLYFQKLKMFLVSSNLTRI